MCLAHQISDMEEELAHYQRENSKLDDALESADSRIQDLEFDCEELAKFIAYIDETNPELRVAYDALRTLEGAKT